MHAVGIDTPSNWANSDIPLTVSTCSFEGICVDGGINPMGAIDERRVLVMAETCSSVSESPPAHTKAKIINSSDEFSIFE